MKLTYFVVGVTSCWCPIPEPGSQEGYKLLTGVASYIFGLSYLANHSGTGSQQGGSVKCQSIKLNVFDICLL